MDDSVRQKIIEVATAATIGMGYPGECGTMALRHLSGHLGRPVELEEEELFRETWTLCVSRMGGAKADPEGVE